MKIQYNKNEVIAAARYLVANKPSAKISSEIPNTARGYLPERGYVDDILRSIREVAKDNEKVYEAIQQNLAAGKRDVDHVHPKWVEVLGVGGYWIIADMESADLMNIAIAVTPWFGEYNSTFEEI
ncbi:MAG: hypothetical protein KJ795_06395 [Gammaproteobacteria bacterium]|nr:hypothetical protein [Gammaproteobacteria bacterium]MBU1777533.1 hypothetical protein [Gammaproteobacteria bacterium]MBU1969611.1 hypothetical protein [Gammaproteobacteria bacterium]